MNAGTTGILFKFAVDKLVSDGKWLYGGTKPDHAQALKVANHELRGLLGTLALARSFSLFGVRATGALSPDRAPEQRCTTAPVPRWSRWCR